MKKVSRLSLVLCLCSGALLLAGPVLARPASAPPAKGQATTSSQGVVNINTASEEQLQLLPRIGPAKARRIVQYRGKQKFKATWDLTRVKGIGRKTYRLLRPFLTVQGGTTLGSKARPEQEKE